MRLKIGNFTGPQGKQGEEGKKGDTGETGQRGSRWTSGTAITGTDTIGTKCPDSGITDALVHDYYVNVDTGNLYECTVPGTADVAEWVHIGNIKGPTGATGPAGSISDINNQKPTYSEASNLSNIESGETVQIAFGKLKKALSVLISHYMQKATQSILGHVKLSNSAAITTPGEYALDAIEKNASVEGTLANMLSQVNSNLAISVAASGEYYTGALTLVKSGKVVQVEGELTCINGGNDAAPQITFPNGYIPVRRAISPVYDASNRAVITDLVACANTDGAFGIIPIVWDRWGGVTGTTYYISFTYLCA